MGKMGYLEADQRAADAGCTVQQISDMRHAMAANKNTPMRSWCYRNYFACSKSDEPSWEKLVKLGFAKRGGKFYDSWFYHVTLEGAKLLGISTARYNNNTR